MNHEILKKYDVSFKTTSHGKLVNAKNRVSSFLFLYRNLEDVSDFISHIDSIVIGEANPYEYSYGEPVLNIYATLTTDELILMGKDNLNPLFIPLTDFKELLLAWREYLTI